MTTSLDEIRRNLAALSRADRLALIRMLLDFEQGEQYPQADEDWDREIKARIEALDAGILGEVSYEEIAREIDARFERR